MVSGGHCRAGCYRRANLGCCAENKSVPSTAVHPAISAVVCTHNRAELLRKALRSVVEQTLRPAQYEIVVVNNASTDETDRVVHEARPGLGYARNTGHRAARGEYVAYLDDDAQAAPDWLEQALRCFGEVGPTPVVVGGPILPEYEGAKPGWFKDGYETRSWGSATRLLRDGESFSGSNMVWNKRVLREIGGFDTEVGVRGDRLGMGEETLTFWRLWRKCAESSVYYSPTLIVHHWTPRSRMRLIYRLRRAFAGGQDGAISLLREQDRPLRALLVLRLLGSVGYWSCRAVVRRAAHRHWQNWAVEEWSLVAHRMGVLAGLLGIRLRTRRV